MGLRKLGETKRGAHFGSFLRLLLFFRENYLETGVYYIDICFFDVCSKCVKYVPFHKQKPAKRQKLYISRRDGYTYDWHLSQIESKPAV